MREGFVAMFGALDFGGIWERAARANPAWNVLDKLEKLVPKADEVRGAMEDANAQLEQAGELQHTDVRTLFFSGTVVVAARAEDATGKDAQSGIWAALLSAGCIVSGVLANAANTPDPKLTYRGCIAYGEYDASANFVIGPAVDEAASLAVDAEAGLVWFAPSAKLVMDGIRLRRPDDLIRPWQVPLKGDRCFDTYVISPYAGVNEQSWGLLRQKILGTFSNNSIDVRLKAQYTDKFLKHELDRLQRDRMEAASGDSSPA
jgi:hypothetical protein